MNNRTCIICSFILEEFPDFFNSVIVNVKIVLTRHHVSCFHKFGVSSHGFTHGICNQCPVYYRKDKFSGNVAACKNYHRLVFGQLHEAKVRQHCNNGSISLLYVGDITQMIQLVT